MNVRAVPIGDFTESVRTWTPTKAPNQTFTYIDLSSVDQSEKRIKSASKLYGSEAPSRARQLIRKGDILVSTVRPNLNAVAAVTAEFDGATASTGFCVLRPKNKLLASNYLMHWVRSPQFVNQMVGEATGASYPAVSDRIVKSSQVPMLPFDEQLRIAAILDTADALHGKRKRALDLLESLTQPIFLEMFGDPITNPRGWSRVLLGEVADFSGGATPPKENSSFWVGDIPWVSPKDMKRMVIADSEDHVNDEAIRGSALRLIPANSILIVVRGMILAHTFPVGIAGRELTVNQDMKAIQFRECVLPDFGFWSIRAISSYVLSKVATAAHGTKRIEMNEIRSLPVLVPPLSRQRKFAEIAKRVMDLRDASSNATKGAVDNFASLQHRAFSGQL